MTDCDFCDDGGCLLCQMEQPVEAAASSPHGRVVGKHDGNLGHGNSRTSRRGSGVYEQRPADRDPTVARGPEGKLCPICGMRYRDLYHHYAKRHPGAVFKDECG